MTLSNGDFEQILLDRWSHGKKLRILRAPRVYFHMENLYYKFMVVFIKKMSLFLLTIVANKILSIISWLIDCKFWQRNEPKVRRPLLLFFPRKINLQKEQNILPFFGQGK